MGDEVRDLNILTKYSKQTYKHILLPVWNATYRYKNKTYRYMVNGETGHVIGYVPRSAWKITFFTLFMLFCLLAIVIGVLWFKNQSASV